jgi:hypothetical protein
MLLRNTYWNLTETCFSDIDYGAKYGFATIGLITVMMVQQVFHSSTVKTFWRTTRTART